MTKEQETIISLMERRADRERRKIKHTVETIVSIVCVTSSVAFLSWLEIEDMRAKKEAEAAFRVVSAIERQPVPLAQPVETPAVEVEAEPAEEYIEDFENEKIEAALAEQGYIRADIPLDNETQILLRSACEEAGIEYELALAVIWKETTFRNIMGDNGESYGYMQIQQKWHEARMDRLGVTDLNDPYSNFRVGCDYLSELIDTYDGNVEMALMAYNAGIGGANKYWFSNGIYTNSYSQAVLVKYAELKGGE